MARDPATPLGFTRGTGARSSRAGPGRPGHPIGHSIYGINTGFGKLANVRIETTSGQLQTNLIRSHAAAWAARSRRRSSAPSCCSGPTVLLASYQRSPSRSGDALVALLNGGVIPLVPEQGSVGASGDLAPLSHIGLALMGEGQVLSRDGTAVPAAGALAAAKLDPYRFAPKEGLAFINGTQAQTAMLALMVHDANVLWRTAVGAAARSLEAYGEHAAARSRIHWSGPIRARSARRH